MLDYISGRFGRRGACLIVLGAAWFILGVGVGINPQPTQSWVLYQSLPHIVQAAGWCTSGVVAVLFGLRGAAAADTVDWPGHVALYLMPAIRTVSFALSWLAWVVTSTGANAGWWTMRVGWSGGWYAAIVWGLFLLMLRLIADWPNPRVMIAPPPSSGGGESV